MMETKSDNRPADEAVHAWFALSYSSYAVLPRVLMQSMPGAWQRDMVRLLEQLRDAFEHVPQPECYDVQAAEEIEAHRLTDAQMALAGVTRGLWGPGEDGELVYRDRDGNALWQNERVLVPVINPLPAYNRGRTRIPPGPRGWPAAPNPALDEARDLANLALDILRSLPTDPGDYDVSLGSERLPEWAGGEAETWQRGDVTAED